LVKGDPSKDKLVGPKIATLRKEVEAGNKTAVTQFWRDVEKSGTPLAEPIEGNDADLQVTFLWRATEETRNVFIMWFPFAAAKPADYQLNHLANTDVWYRTLKTRKGARFFYQLSPNDPIAFDDDSGPIRTATAQADPLNPRRWLDNPN